VLVLAVGAGGLLAGSSHTSRGSPRGQHGESLSEASYWRGKVVCLSRDLYGGDDL
jgi:hypothetical protein